MADMMSSIPEMDDAALKNLHDNAERLAREGDGKRKAAAEAMLPALEAELSARADAKAAARVAKARETRRRKLAAE